LKISAGKAKEKAKSPKNPNMSLQSLMSGGDNRGGGGGGVVEKGANLQYANEGEDRAKKYVTLSISISGLI